MKHIYSLLFICNLLLPTLYGETSSDVEYGAKTDTYYDRDITKAIDGIDRREYYKQYQTRSQFDINGKELTSFLWGYTRDQGVDHYMHLAILPGSVYLFKYVKIKGTKIIGVTAKVGKSKLRGTKLDLEGLGDINSKLQLQTRLKGLGVPFHLTFLSGSEDLPGDWLGQAQRFKESGNTNFPVEIPY